MIVTQIIEALTIYLVKGHLCFIEYEIRYDFLENIFTVEFLQNPIKMLATIKHLWKLK